MWRIAVPVAAVFACMCCGYVYATLFILSQVQHEESSKFMYQMRESADACSADAAAELIDCT
jgi:hypothetical protein